MQAVLGGGRQDLGSLESSEISKQGQKEGRALEEMNSYVCGA